MKTWELTGFTVDLTGAALPHLARPDAALPSADRAASTDAEARFVQLLAEVAGPELERRDREDARRRSRIRRVRDVIRHGRLVVLFQPILDLERLVPVGVEALGRIRGLPCQGPSWWFQEAESVGLRTELEIAAARVALASVADLPLGTELWLNASPATIGTAALERAIATARPTRTVVELTEHSVVDDYGRLADSVERLRALGARLAVDDVGAGASTFRHILHLAPDVIKLDMALIQGIETDPRRRALVTAMVGFAGEVGIQLTAEGIESEAQLHTLRRLGVRFGQGFHLGRPGTPAALTRSVSEADPPFMERAGPVGAGPLSR
jgi:EAL domain-containing protein (putative c-di-GMP-specific phosphodiesterase class I)